MQNGLQANFFRRSSALLFLESKDNNADDDCISPAHFDIVAAVFHQYAKALLSD